MQSKTENVNSKVNSILNFTGLNVLIENKSAIKKYLTDKNFRKWVNNEESLEPLRHMVFLYVFALSFAGVMMVL